MKKRIIKILTLGVLLTQINTINSWAETKGNINFRNYDPEAVEEIKEVEKKEVILDYYQELINGKISKEELVNKVGALETNEQLENAAKKELIVEYYDKFSSGEISKEELVNNCNTLEVNNTIKETIVNAESDSERLLARTRQVFTDEMLDKMNNTFDATGAMKGRVATNSTSGMVWGLAQVTQSNSYYCGPATAKMILDDKNGTNLGQLNYAHTLGTTRSGTEWRQNGYYPMQNCLNSYTNSSFYVAYPATTNDKEALKGKVKYTINADWGIAANIYSPKNGSYRLPGYPSDRAIEHWIAIDGYYDNGNTIHYADPVYGASSISWSSNITSRYTNVSATTMAYLIWERGIIY